jgi:hypothetical protein
MKVANGRESDQQTMTELSDQDMASVSCTRKCLAGLGMPWRWVTKSTIIRHLLYRNTSVVTRNMVSEHMQDTKEGELGELLTKFLLWDRKDTHRNSITNEGTGSLAGFISQRNSLVRGLQRR